MDAQLAIRILITIYLVVVVLRLYFHDSINRELSAFVVTTASLAVAAICYKLEQYLGMAVNCFFAGVVFSDVVRHIRKGE